MRLLMIAPPGAGKGTQGVRIARHFDIAHIATGDLLRDHVARGTEVGREVQSYLDRGALVPDDLVLDMVRQALEKVQATGGGYVIDGHPRTPAQAWAAYRIATRLGVTAEVALHLRVDDAEVVRRLLARATTEHRSDDTESVIRRRLDLYHEVTQPVLDWYAERGILVSVDGMHPAGEVTAGIIAALRAERPAAPAWRERAPALASAPAPAPALAAA